MAEQDRNTYIGSSDARDILSGNWDKLYREKMGLAERADLSDVFPVQFGAFVEEFHLDWTFRRHNEEKNGGFEWSKFDGKGEQHHAEFIAHSENKPRLISHPDALGLSDTGHLFPVEAKLTGRFRNAEEAADFYMPQLQHHMICWDVPTLLFSVVIGTAEPERIWVGRSLEWEHHYLTRCEEFWGHILRQHPPAPTLYDTHTPKPIVPAAVSNSVPLNGYKKRDMTGNNRWKAIVGEFLETKEAVARHDKAKTDLKGMMAEDENHIFDEQIELKRDKRGAIRFTIKDKEAA
jgi:hypothetical protein